MTLSIKAEEFTVWVDGSANRNLRVRQVEHSIGGHRLDSATIYYDSTRTSDMLRNYALFDEFGDREIEITNSRGVVLHWGKVAIVRPSLGQGYDLSLISRTEPHHFGEPIVGRWHYVQTANGIEIARYDRPLVFNPLLDGKIVPNKSGITASGYFYFCDETLSYTQHALQYAREPITNPKKLKPWKLADCVRYLCGVANEDEKYIKNPDNTQLDSQIEDDGELIKDVQIPDGVFLPAALDMLLTPYGYQWQVIYLGMGKRQIFVQKKGKGAEVTVGYQPYGAALDLDKTIIERLDVQYDAASKTATELTVYGGHGEVEATFELVPAWPEEKDTYNTTDTDHLQLDTDEYADDPTLHRVWRDWVLNEAGDYIGIRDDIKRPYDLSEIFDADDYVVRRRRFLPTLTLDDDGAPIGRTQGVKVEWSTQTDVWNDLELMEEGGANQVVLLERECGIRFSGLTPPWTLMAAGVVAAKIRVTATLQCDKRLTRTEPVTGSFAQERIPVSLVMPGAFQKRTIHESSTFYDQVKAGTLDSAEVDDTDKLRKFIKRLAGSMDTAECSGVIQLHGLDYTYQLGQAITRVTGREIQLTTAAGKYPLIVGIIYDVPNQTTTLVLDAYRDAIEQQLNLSRRPRRSREEVHP